MRANVYIDAFNLYYGCLKDTSCKWLNLRAFCEAQVPGKYSVCDVKVCLAEVGARSGDPDQPRRQGLYVRALSTLTNLTIHKGRFLTTQKRMKHVNPPPSYVDVWKTEEKGSDVNLATLLLCDGYEGA